MPGLVCVLGRDRAADLAERAARPLVRRSWQRFELAPTRDDVALGFAGEHGGVAHDPETGVALALDGELFGDSGALTGADAARELLHTYLDVSFEEDIPQGAFAAGLWDPRTESLVLLTDQHGRRNVWMAESGGVQLFAGELKALLAAGVEPSLDLEAWSQFFAYEGALSGHSPLEGVALLAGATRLEISRGRKKAHTRWRYRLEPEDVGDVEEWADDFAQLLDAAVRRRLGNVGLALSGGYDSRCVGSILAKRAPDTKALTFGQPGSTELRLGTEVARILGLPHRTEPFEPGYLARGAAETVWLSEGAIRAFHAHHLYLRPLLTKDGAGAVLINYGGDHVLRAAGGTLQARGESVEGDNFHRFRAEIISDEFLEEIFTPGFAAQVRGLARTSLRRHLDEEEGTPVQKARHVGYNALTRKIWPGAELFTDFLAPRDPYDDHADAVEEGAEDDDDLGVVAGHPVVADQRGLDVVLRELAEQLERDVRDDLDVHPGVVVDLEALDRVHVRDVPPGFHLVVLVDPLHECRELAVRARRDLDPHLRDRLGGRQAGLFLRLFGDRILDPLLGLLVELGHECRA